MPSTTYLALWLALQEALLLALCDALLDTNAPENIRRDVGVARDRYLRGRDGIAEVN